MAHGINHSGDTLIALSAFFPYLRDHVRLSVMEKGTNRMKEFRNAKTLGIVAYHTGHTPLEIAQRVNLHQADPALRHGNQDVQHVDNDEGVRRVITVQTNKKVDVLSAIHNGFFRVHHEVDPFRAFIDAVSRNQPNTGLLIGGQQLQFGSRLHFRVEIVFYPPDTGTRMIGKFREGFPERIETIFIALIALRKSVKQTVELFIFQPVVFLRVFLKKPDQLLTHFFGEAFFLRLLIRVQFVGILCDPVPEETVGGIRCPVFRIQTASLTNGDGIQFVLFIQ